MRISGGKLANKKTDKGLVQRVKENVASQMIREKIFF